MTKKRDEIRDYLNETSKPLTWRTGEIPIDRRDETFLIQSSLRDGYYLTPGWTLGFGEKWLPLSDILNLIGGE